MTERRRSTTSKKLEAALSDLTFLPSPEQRKVKAAFWASYTHNPLARKDNITMAAALDIVGDSRLQRWWSLPGFSEWFTNKDEFKQRVEYLAHLSLDAIEEVLLDPGSNANARIKAAQLMIEVSNKLPARQVKEKYLDAAIQDMDQRQLEEYIRRAIPPAKVVNSGDTKDKADPTDK